MNGNSGQNEATDKAKGRGVTDKLAGSSQCDSHRIEPWEWCQSLQGPAGAPPVQFANSQPLGLALHGSLLEAQFPNYTFLDYVYLNLD